MSIHKTMRLFGVRMKTILLVPSKSAHSCLCARTTAPSLNSRSIHALPLHSKKFQSLLANQHRTFQRPGIQRRLLSFLPPQSSQPNDSGSLLAAAATETEPADSTTISLVDSLISTTDPVPIGWTPAALAEYGIVAIHDAFGFPWYLSIAGITVALRTMLFPLVIYQVGVGSFGTSFKTPAALSPLNRFCR